MKEQTFFNDPALDRLMGVVMSLAAEVYMLHDRNRTLEILLAQQGIISPTALEEFQPDPQQRKQTLEERDAFVARILEPIVSGGKAVSKAKYVENR